MQMTDRQKGREVEEKKRRGRRRERKIEQEAPVAHESVKDWIHTELD